MKNAPPVKFSWQVYGGAVTVQPGALLIEKSTRTTPTLSDALTLTVRVPDVTCAPLAGSKFESTGGVVSAPPVSVGVRVGVAAGVRVGVAVGGTGVLVGAPTGVFVGVGVGGGGLASPVETDIAEDNADSLPAISRADTR